MTDTPDAASLREQIARLKMLADIIDASPFWSDTRESAPEFSHDIRTILALLPQEPGEALEHLCRAPDFGVFLGRLDEYPAGKPFSAQIDAWIARASKAEAERDELRGLLETTRDYLLEMSENQLRNDIDMRLDPIKDPELVASDITATLAKGDGA